MKPGEVASAHQHSASALRFIMEGKGAYTIVDGHKMTLGENDFVLTPNGSWHEHGVAEDGTECIWQDGLDIQLVNCLEANFYAVHGDLKQQVAYPVDDSTASWGAPVLQPAGAHWSKPYSPVFLYKWDDAYREVKKLGRHEYANPLTGGPVMPTMGARLDLVKEAKAIRHTGSQIYQVATGRGWSEVGGQRFEWQEKDIFCVPSWTKYRHGAHGEAVLFSFNDIPAMKALALYREAHD
jgi:gentisate 1,2-dioxygenase